MGGEPRLGHSQCRTLSHDLYQYKGGGGGTYIHIIGDGKKYAAAVEDLDEDSVMHGKLDVEEDDGSCLSLTKSISKLMNAFRGLVGVVPVVLLGGARITIHAKEYLD